MTPGILQLGMATVLGSEPTSAADSVTLRDGTVVLGQVVEPAPRGTLLLLVRRAWAEAQVPDWAERWQEAEASRVELARSRRRERLSAWRRQRRPEPGRDPVGAWIDAELARLQDDEE